MNQSQKAQIIHLRSEGKTYKEISITLNLPLNTIKSFCHRQQANSDSTVAISPKKSCKQCGNPINQLCGHKEKLFCSDSCRMKWWNEHQSDVHRKAMYEFTCKHCGKVFLVYGNANRKYCSHECYIAERFCHE